MNGFSRFLALIALLTAVAATKASAELRYETGDGGYMLLYGQFDPAHLSFDDGVSTTSETADNTNSNSRVGFWYRQITDSGEFSINLETSLGLRQSGLVSQNRTPDSIDWQRTNIRKVEAIWKGNRYGTIYLGQGSMSSDGASGYDLSGTTLVLYNSIPDTAGAFQFRTTAGALSNKTITQAFGSFDGGRKTRMRYDTPSFGGVRLSASYGEEVLNKNVNETVADVGLMYSEQIGSVTIVGGLAYSRNEFEAEAPRHDTVGSFSLLHYTGLNVTVAAGNRDETGRYIYGKLGYQVELFPLGKTAMAIDYYSGDDKISKGSDTTSVGISIVQSFDRANIDVYLGYREYSLTETGASYLDASSIMFGTRWKF